MVRNLSRLITSVFCCFYSSLAISNDCGDLFSGTQKFPLEKAVTMYSIPEISKHLMSRQVTGTYEDIGDNVIQSSPVKGLFVGLSVAVAGVDDHFLVQIAVEGEERPVQYIFSTTSYPHFTDFILQPPNVKLDLKNLPIASEVKDGKAVDISNWITEVLNTQDTVHGTINSLAQLVGHRVSIVYQKMTPNLRNHKIDKYDGDVVRIDRTEHSEYGIYDLVIRNKDNQLVSLGFGNNLLSSFLHIAIRMPEDS